MKFQNLIDQLRLKMPPTDIPSQNQGGISPPAAPQPKTTVPLNYGSVGRPPENVGPPKPPPLTQGNAWTERDPRGGPMPTPGQPGKIQDDPRFRELDRQTQRMIEGSGDPWGTLANMGKGAPKTPQPMVGAPEAPPQPGVYEGKQPIPEDWKRMKQAGGEKKEVHEVQPTDETGTPLQPGGVPSKQLPGQFQPNEYTVTRPMSHQEISTAPPGVINTPHAMIEKDPTGKISVKGLTEQGKVKLERMKMEDTKKFGNWFSDLDPSAPPPPIRPGMRAFNPLTGQWINNENSILEELGGGG